MKADGLKKSQAAKRKTAKRVAVRFGRPPKEFAGEVDARILDAARKVFLERGFDGASIDEIAETARSGKPTIYARFAGKEALFTAVVTQTVAANVAQVEAHAASSGTIEQRLQSVAVTALEWILLSD